MLLPSSVSFNWVNRCRVVTLTIHWTGRAQQQLSWTTMKKMMTYSIEMRMSSMKMVESFSMMAKLQTLHKNLAFWLAQKLAASATLINSWLPAIWSHLRLCLKMEILRRYIRWIPTNQSQTQTLRDAFRLWCLKEIKACLTTGRKAML